MIAECGGNGQPCRRDAPDGIMSLMNRVLPGRTFFTAAYILLTIGFLTIHFTRVENFSAVVGGVVVKGRSSIGTSLSPPQIRRLSLRANGTNITFRKSDRAVLVTDDGIRHSLNIENWSSEGNTLKISFNQGAAFTLKTDTHGKEIILIPEIPKTVPPVRSLEIPFHPEKGGGMTLSPNNPESLSVSTPEMKYMASLPKDSSWNPENGRLNLVVLDKADPILVISDNQRGSGLNAVEWIKQGVAPSQETYDRAVGDWLSLARNGWKATLSASTGEVRWNDALAAAVLADSVQRRDLPSQLQTILSLADRFPRAIGWLSCPYLGNIVNQSRIHTDEMSAEAKNLTAALQSGEFQPGRFQPGDKSALTVLLDFGAGGSADSLLKTIRLDARRDIPNPEAVAHLSLLHEAVRLSLEETSSDPLIRRRLFDEIIIPKIFWVKDGLWLVEDDGSIDMRINIAVADLLMEESKWNNDSQYQGIGRQMMLSMLDYADANGSVPSKILFEGEGEVIREGRIAPETLYPTVIAPPAYPRHVSLAAELGPGSWAITGAERFTVRGTPRETTITMDFPADSIHHFAIKGIKKFQVLYMRGIKWNGDPAFQRYHSGWNYDEANETLYVKIRHRSTTETIRILHYDPEAGSPAPSPASETAG